MFAGFLPAKARARETELAELAGIRATLIFYESPHRLAATLAAMATVLGDREAAVTRELTKKFEEVVTGRLGELAIRYAESQPKGEIVLVVGPPAEAPPPSADDLDALLLDRLATDRKSTRLNSSH